jgi:hypothetical protein
MNEDELQPIECRAAVEIPSYTSNEILFLPTGVHGITPVAGGIGRPIKVKVGYKTAQVIEEQRAKLHAQGKRPYFDFNHHDDRASFWPKSFIWRQGDGVVALGEWTATGRQAVEGKDYRAFSPVFHVDNKRADPAEVVCKDQADPNMGGLVNNPAFKDLPLWAKNAGASGASTTTKKENKMNDEIAALRAKHKELQQEVASTDPGDESLLNAKQAELHELDLQIEAAELRASNAAMESKLRKRAQEDAAATVRAAVKRGAILARDTKSQKDWEARITADPTAKDLLAAVPGHDAITGRSVSYNSRVTITEEEPAAIFAAIASKLAASRKAADYRDRMQLSKDIAGIYNREMGLSVIRAGSANAERVLAFPVADLASAIAAADVTDTNLDTLSGTLVTQRTLELLKFDFPSLGMFTTDFSDQAAQFNQTIMTRTVDVPSIVTYNTSTGWSDSTATTQDVPVTIDKHEGVNITFNENILASTVRRLFDEFAPASAYALAKSMVDDLYSNITDANFPNNTVSATSTFDRGDVIDIGVALDLQGVPLATRTLLLYPTVFGKLKQDTAVVNLGAYQRAELFTEARRGTELVFPLDSFTIVSAPNLPTNNGNVTGFACSKSALIIATRVPNDYTAAMSGASYGNVQMVTNPDIGITVMLVQYVDHQLGRATSRIALMYGTAAGQANAGRLLKAAAGSGSSRT